MILAYHSCINLIDNLLYISYNWWSGYVVFLQTNFGENQIAISNKIITSIALHDRGSSIQKKDDFVFYWFIFEKHV
jgi:hypothetical protein